MYIDKRLQRERHRKWLEDEGGIEGPTHSETLQSPEQQVRIAWLRDKCKDTKNILDIGCNWGFILNEVDGRCGVDINPVNIDLAMLSFPTRLFRVGDVTEGLDFTSFSFHTVIMADVLEHIDWSKVFKSLEEALRIARKSLLITLPWGKSEDCRYCFKHKWIPDESTVSRIVFWLARHSEKVSIKFTDKFLLIGGVFDRCEY